MNQISEEYTDAEFYAGRRRRVRRRLPSSKREGVRTVPSFHFWKGNSRVEVINGANIEAVTKAKSTRTRVAVAQGRLVRAGGVVDGAQGRALLRGPSRCRLYLSHGRARVANTPFRQNIAPMNDLLEGLEARTRRRRAHLGSTLRRRLGARHDLPTTGAATAAATGATAVPSAASSICRRLEGARFRRRRTSAPRSSRRRWTSLSRRTSRCP